MITLKTLPYATQQEVFDQAAVHLLTQKSVSIIRDVCRYKADGKKCAAGCFISDEEYNIKMEGNNWASLIQNGLVADSTHMGIILELQCIHDTHDVQSWKSRLITLARKYTLSIEKIINL